MTNTIINIEYIYIYIIILMVVTPWIFFRLVPILFESRRFLICCSGTKFFLQMDILSWQSFPTGTREKKSQQKKRNTVINEKFDILVSTQVICLQSFARRWLARQEVDSMRTDRDRRLAWLEMQERSRTEETKEQLRDRRRRWMNPQRREDFNLLYHALESRPRRCVCVCVRRSPASELSVFSEWRCEEEQRINSSLRGAERKAALCSLLQQETQLIDHIGRHRIAARSDNYEQSVMSFLDKVRGHCSTSPPGSLNPHQQCFYVWWDMHF